MTYKFSDIVLVDFPFSSSLGSKKRPAVVVSSNKFNKDAEDAILMAITSKVDKLRIGESQILNWKESGLLRESAFKSIVFTVEKQFISKKIGSLSEQDTEQLHTSLNEVFDLKS